MRWGTTFDFPSWGTGDEEERRSLERALVPAPKAAATSRCRAHFHRGSPIPEWCRDWCTNPRSLHQAKAAERGSVVRRSNGSIRRAAGQRYSMRKPEIAREITSCWICSVPSKMSMILASRWKRSTGYSRV